MGGKGDLQDECKAEARQDTELLENRRTRRRGEPEEVDISAYTAQALPARPFPYHPLDPYLETLRKAPSPEHAARRHETFEHHNWSPPRGGNPSSSFLHRAFGFALIRLPDVSRRRPHHNTRSQPLQASGRHCADAMAFFESMSTIVSNRILPICIEESSYPFHTPSSSLTSTLHTPLAGLVTLSLLQCPLHKQATTQQLEGETPMDGERRREVRCQHGETEDAVVEIKHKHEIKDAFRVWQSQDTQACSLNIWDTQALTGSAPDETLPSRSTRDVLFRFRRLADTPCTSPMPSRTPRNHMNRTKCSSCRLRPQDELVVREAYDICAGGKEGDPKEFAKSEELRVPDTQTGESREAMGFPEQSSTDDTTAAITKSRAYQTTLRQRYPRTTFEVCLKQVSRVGMQRDTVGASPEAQTAQRAPCSSHHSAPTAPDLCGQEGREALTVELGRDGQAARKPRGENSQVRPRHIASHCGHTLEPADLGSLKDDEPVDLGRRTRGWPTDRAYNSEGKRFNVVMRCGRGIIAGRTNKRNKDQRVPNHHAEGTLTGGSCEHAGLLDLGGRFIPQKAQCKVVTGAESTLVEFEAWAQRQSIQAAYRCTYRQCTGGRARGGETPDDVRRGSEDDEWHVMQDAVSSRDTSAGGDGNMRILRGIAQEIVNRRSQGRQQGEIHLSGSSGGRVGSCMEAHGRGHDALPAWYERDSSAAASSQVEVQGIAWCTRIADAASTFDQFDTSWIHRAPRDCSALMNQAGALARGDVGAASTRFANKCTGTKQDKPVFEPVTASARPRIVCSVSNTLRSCCRQGTQYTKTREDYEIDWPSSRGVGGQAPGQARAEGGLWSGAHSALPRRTIEKAGAASCLEGGGVGPSRRREVRVEGPLESVRVGQPEAKQVEGRLITRIHSTSDVVHVSETPLGSENMALLTRGTKSSQGAARGHQTPADLQGEGQRAQGDPCENTLLRGCALERAGLSGLVCNGRVDFSTQMRAWSVWETYEKKDMHVNGEALWHSSEAEEECAVVNGSGANGERKEAFAVVAGEGVEGKDHGTTRLLRKAWVTFAKGLSALPSAGCLGTRSNLESVRSVRAEGRLAGVSCRGKSTGRPEGKVQLTSLDQQGAWSLKQERGSRIRATVASRCTSVGWDEPVLEQRAAGARTHTASDMNNAPTSYPPPAQPMIETREDSEGGLSGDRRVAGGVTKEPLAEGRSWSVTYSTARRVAGKMAFAAGCVKTVVVGVLWSGKARIEYLCKREQVESVEQAEGTLACNARQEHSSGPPSILHEPSPVPTEGPMVKICGAGCDDRKRGWQIRRKSGDKQGVRTAKRRGSRTQNRSAVVQASLDAKGAGETQGVTRAVECTSRAEGDVKARVCEMALREEVSASSQRGYLGRAAVTTLQPGPALPRSKGDGILRAKGGAERSESNVRGCKHAAQYRGSHAQHPYAHVPEHRAVARGKAAMLKQNLEAAIGDGFEAQPYGVDPIALKSIRHTDYTEPVLAIYFSLFKAPRKAPETMTCIAVKGAQFSQCLGCTRAHAPRITGTVARHTSQHVQAEEDVSVAHFVCIGGGAEGTGGIDRLRGRRATCRGTGFRAGRTTNRGWLTRVSAGEDVTVARSSEWACRRNVPGYELEASEGRHKQVREDVKVERLKRRKIEMCGPRFSGSARETSGVGSVVRYGSTPGHRQKPEGRLLLSELETSIFEHKSCEGASGYRTIRQNGERRLRLDDCTQFNVADVGSERQGGGDTADVAYRRPIAKAGDMVCESQLADSGTIGGRAGAGVGRKIGGGPAQEGELSCRTRVQWTDEEVKLETPAGGEFSESALERNEALKHCIHERESTARQRAHSPEGVCGNLWVILVLGFFAAVVPLLCHEKSMRGYEPGAPVLGGASQNSGAPEAMTAGQGVRQGERGMKGNRSDESEKQGAGRGVGRIGQDSSDVGAGGPGETSQQPGLHSEEDKLDSVDELQAMEFSAHEECEYSKTEEYEKLRGCINNGEEGTERGRPEPAKSTLQATAEREQGARVEHSRRQEEPEQLQKVYPVHEESGPQSLELARGLEAEGVDRSDIRGQECVSAERPLVCWFTGKNGQYGQYAAGEDLVDEDGWGNAWWHGDDADQRDSHKIDNCAVSEHTEPSGLASFMQQWMALARENELGADDRGYEEEVPREMAELGTGKGRTRGSQAAVARREQGQVPQVTSTEQDDWLGKKLSTAGPLHDNLSHPACEAARPKPVLAGAQKVELTHQCVNFLEVVAKRKEAKTRAIVPAQSVAPPIVSIAGGVVEMARSEGDVQDVMGIVDIDGSSAHGTGTSGRETCLGSTSMPLLVRHGEGTSHTKTQEPSARAPGGHEPTDNACWLLGDFGDLDLDIRERPVEEDLVGCFHLAEEGCRTWGYIPRDQAKVALRSVPQTWESCDADEKAFERRRQAEEAEREAMLALFNERERVRIRGLMADRSGRK